MGWGKILGEFAKGYVAERGIEGTIEDVVKLTQKGSEVVNKFNQKVNEYSDEYDEYDSTWDDFLNEFNALLDEHEYDVALELLVDFYKHNYANNFDTSYYFNHARAFIGKGYQACHRGQFEEAKFFVRQIEKDINKCARIATREDQEIVVFLHDRLDELNEDIESFQALEETIEEIEKYRQPNTVYTGSKKSDCGKALTLLLAYYDNYGEEKDWFYFDWRAKIYNALFAALTNSQQERKFVTSKELQTYFSDALDSISRAARLCEDDDEDILALEKRLKEQIEELKGKFKEDASINYSGSSLQSMSSNSKAEQEYLDELRECLKDGITDRERRLLDRLRKSLGISEARALELEKSLNQSLTDEEQEYLEELKVSLQDGAVSERERRLLDRLRKSLGISEERGQELERMV